MKSCIGDYAVSVQFYFRNSSLYKDMQLGYSVMRELRLYYATKNIQDLTKEEEKFVAYKQNGIFLPREILVKHDIERKVFEMVKDFLIYDENNSLRYHSKETKFEL